MPLTPSSVPEFDIRGVGKSESLSADGRLRCRNRWTGRHCIESPKSLPFLLPPRTTSTMPASPRLSDHELANINAAAVTREYTVKPHLGEDLGERA